MRAFLVATFAALVVAGCATKAKKAPPPVPPMEEVRAPAAADAHLDDVRKSAAEQLACPIEDVTVTCLRRDSQGDCISVRADGCDKTFEYQFGDV